MSEPRFSISEISTLPASLAEDVAAYAAEGVEGIGIWELKLPEGGDAQAVELLAESGLVATNAVPLVPSILPFPRMEGPADPAERVEALCHSVHRLARFGPLCVLLLTGPAGALDADSARATVLDGLHTVAHEAESLGVRLGLEPAGPFEAENWTIVSTIGDAVALLDEADVPHVGVMFDVWNLWSSPQLEREIEDHAGRFAGVHVADWREPTRSYADRVLPGDGVANVPRILGALERAGWTGFYDLELFSDNGPFGHVHPDSLWELPPHELARRGRDAFLACWRARPAESA